MGKLLPNQVRGFGAIVVIHASSELDLSAHVVHDYFLQKQCVTLSTYNNDSYIYQTKHDFFTNSERLKYSSYIKSNK